MKRDLPKPKWRELVSPYDRAPSPATIRSHIAHYPGWTWISRSACGCIKAIPLAPYIERFGVEITFAELRRRMRCATCGENPESFSLPVDDRFPPIDRVPEALRGYATIDVKHQPAPLRGRAQIGTDLPEAPKF